MSEDLASISPPTDYVEPYSDQSQLPPYPEFRLTALLRAMLNALRDPESRAPIFSLRYRRIGQQEIPSVALNAYNLVEEIFKRLSVSALTHPSPLPDPLRCTRRRFGPALRTPPELTETLYELIRLFVEDLEARFATTTYAQKWQFVGHVDLVSWINHQLQLGLRFSEEIIPVRLYSLKPITDKISRYKISKNDVARLLVCHEQAFYGQSPILDLSELLVDGILRYAFQNQTPPTPQLKSQLKELAALPSSHLYQFLRFIDEHGFGRARAAFTRRLMGHLVQAAGMNEQEQRYPCFQAYVERVLWLVEALEQQEINGLITFSGCFFKEGERVIDLAEEVEKISTYRCLPVWLREEAQGSEQRSDSLYQWVANRSTFWRFTVNGKDPNMPAYNERGKQGDALISAFRSRIYRLATAIGFLDEDAITLGVPLRPTIEFWEKQQQRLFWGQPDEEAKPSFNKNAIVSWLFFNLIIGSLIPRNPKDEKNPTVELMDRAQYIAWVEKYLQSLREIVETPDLGQQSPATLRARLQRLWLRLAASLDVKASPIVDEIGKNLIAILRSDKTSPEEVRDIEYTVTISPDILSTMALQCIRGGTAADPIRIDDDSHFWKYISIYPGAYAAPRSLLSFGIRFNGRLHGLVLEDQSQLVVYRRDIQHPVLPIIFKYLEKERDKNTTYDRLGIPYSLEIFYNRQAISNPKLPTELRSLGALTISLVSFIGIAALQYYLSCPTGITFRVLRIHRQEEETYLYAAVRALEVAINQYCRPSRVQGIIQPVSQNPDGQPHERYRWQWRSATQALTAGTPLCFDWPDSPLQHLGIVVVESRPTVQPLIIDKSVPISQSFQSIPVLIARIYQLTVKERQARMELCGMRAAIADQDGYLEAANFLTGCLDILGKQGCRDVLIIEHQLGARRIGEMRHRALWSHPKTYQRLYELLKGTEVIDEVPRMRCYLIRRSIWSATRLKTPRTNKGQHALYVLTDLDQLVYLERQIEPEAIERHLIPIVGIATLKVVGNDANRPQSGLCIYSWLSDSAWEGAPTYHEEIRSRILNPSLGIRSGIISALQALHIFESEVPGPILDPYLWQELNDQAAAAEVLYRSPKRAGEYYLSLLGVLTQAAQAAHQALQFYAEKREKTRRS